MLRIHRFSPLAKAGAVFGAVAIITTSVTFAALQSQASLTNNTISSATANLQVKSSGSFAPQDAGFAFAGVVPGGAAVPATGNAFQLKNGGDIDLAIYASMPAAPTFSGGTVDQSKVKLVLDCTTTGGKAFALTSDLTALVAAHSTGGVLMAVDALPKTTDNIADCIAKVQMDIDALSGSGGVSSTFFNVVFTGKPVAPAI